MLSNPMIIVTPSIQVDRKNNMMILTARSIDHPSYPATNDYVRVQEYRSQMFIRPHKSFDEKGFDYVMSYFDDPQLSVPYWAVNRMTVSSKLNTPDCFPTVNVLIFLTLLSFSSQIK